MKTRHSNSTQQTRQQFIYFCSLILIIAGNLYSQTHLFRTAPLFQDNMVLQQQSNVPIWGKGIPGTTVSIRTSWGKTVSTEVNTDSSWMTRLSTPKAGGPFQITLKHGTTLSIIKNILIGEVWLCSGQSNMEMPLQGWPPNDTIMNSSNEIEQALYPTIRLFTVARSFESLPMEQCVGTWTECSPADVQSFSATAFHFGKTIHNTLKVPVGLINASFGGTAVEAWMDKPSISAIEGYAGIIKRLEESRDSIRMLDEWVEKHLSVSIDEKDPLRKYVGLKFQDEQCSLQNYNDKNWQEINLPLSWEKGSLGKFDGVVWFRKQIVIPSAWIGKDLKVYLGPIDDMDETYVNGQKIGENLREGVWNIDRVYTIPGTLVQDSLIQLAIRVIDLRGGGGLWGNQTKMVLTSTTEPFTVSLEGNWKYLPVAEYRSNKFALYGITGNELAQRPKVAFELTQDTPTSLFNGMINPLIPFTIKGTIWYQGESNVWNYTTYHTLFTSLITGWRKDFQSGDFPFYYVQLAPFQYWTGAKLACLREAQLQTLSLKNTGMAVTLDIGNPTNVHPTNKEDVGKRLAAWALAKTYGKKMPYTGPLYKSLKNVKRKIILSFDGVGKGLLLKERNGEHYFTVAGEDKVFKKAAVKIEGRNIVVSHPEVLHPVAVRYLWSNTEEATLFNNDGFPASSFRTDDWPE
ncbi:MAG: sialate O-acetylesterase [Bacteroidota bacterium]